MRCYAAASVAGSVGSGGRMVGSFTPPSVADRAPSRVYPTGRPSSRMVPPFCSRLGALAVVRALDSSAGSAAGLVVLLVLLGLLLVLLVLRVAMGTSLW